MAEETDAAPRPDTARPPAGEGDPRKRAQVLAGARHVFLGSGFSAASMGEIARAAGVSKGTLYVYFDSKTALFRALIEDEKRNAAERLTAFDPGDHDVGTVLTRFAERFIAELTAAEHVALVRAVVGAAEAFPEIGRAFFEAGPAFGASRLADYLRAQVEDGVLDLDDPQDAAWRFLGACNTPALIATVMGLPAPDPEEIRRRARSVVAAFLHGRLRN
jgi:AcrR family transcriptional regulator